MRNKKRTAVFIAFLAIMSYATAQPSFGDDVEDVAAPIPGLVLAAIVGVAVGVRKLYQKK